eukprot:TRINITY_DN9006_c0_g1_i6.p2 TRINITY_DN9006_c0_g1~~TRINITY_DN9006_c0_g1_i6.p2  ORF type:complete len:172 (+),score=44.49 TRINITY_DN9006_c0_g1_i6:76-591(+)
MCIRDRYMGKNYQDTLERLKMMREETDLLRFNHAQIIETLTREVDTLKAELKQERESKEGKNEKTSSASAGNPSSPSSAAGNKDKEGTSPTEVGKEKEGDASNKSATSSGEGGGFLFKAVAGLFLTDTDRKKIVKQQMKKPDDRDNEVCTCVCMAQMMIEIVCISFISLNY